MAHDPMFRVMDGLSGTSGHYDGPPSESEASSDDDQYGGSRIGYGSGLNMLHDHVAQIEE